MRIMPEFNNSETEVTLYKNIGSSATVVINTTADDITAEYDADWLSVDVNKRRVIILSRLLMRLENRALHLLSFILVNGCKR